LAQFLYPKVAIGDSSPQDKYDQFVQFSARDTNIRKFETKLLEIVEIAVKVAARCTSLQKRAYIDYTLIKGLVSHIMLLLETRKNIHISLKLTILDHAILLHPERTRQDPHRCDHLGENAA
jgi:hypothetical protein